MAVPIVPDGTCWNIQRKADKIIGRFIFEGNVASIEVIAEEQTDAGQGCYPVL